MSRLPQLRASFLDAAERQAGPAGGVRAIRPRRSRLRLGVAIAFVVLLLAAVAVAATGLLRTGSPVRPSGRATPNAGVGVPAPGGSRILHVSGADPAGGPPWGMRLVRTTRALVCVQLGRLYQGALGVLGTDGAFGDDGAFHPLPPDTIDRQSGATSCQPANVGVSLEVSGIPASGLMAADGRLGAVSSDRWISYGLLGADAVSVTYRLGARSHTIPVEPGTGAYVIVSQGIKPGTSQQGTTSGGSSGVQGPGGRALPNPEGAVTAITYRIGNGTCEIGRTAHTPNACPLPPSGRGSPEPTVELHRAISVHLRRAAQPGGYDATLTFVAPYAVPNALSGYSIASPSPCHLGIAVDPVDRDVSAGQKVVVPVEAVFANACGPAVTLEVIYGHGQGVHATGSGNVLVGKITLRRPK